MTMPAPEDVSVFAIVEPLRATEVRADVIHVT